jgi:hypothetical protein
MHHSSQCGCRGRSEEHEGSYGFGRWARHFYPHDAFTMFESGAFGVRRPLRFLAMKLQLDESQVEALAAALNDLKTERAQSAVDDRRAVSAYADAVAGGDFDGAKATEAGERRVAGRKTVEAAVRRFLEKLHGLLSAEQRTRLAYLIRTGTLTI